MTEVNNRLIAHCIIDHITFIIILNALYSFDDTTDLYGQIRWVSFLFWVGVCVCVCGCFCMWLFS